MTSEVSQLVTNNAMVEELFRQRKRSVSQLMTLLKGTNLISLLQTEGSIQMPTTTVTTDSTDCSEDGDSYRRLCRIQ